MISTLKRARIKGDKKKGDAILLNFRSMVYFENKFCFNIYIFKFIILMEKLTL